MSLKNLSVKVNRNHINDGEAESFDTCPVALSIKQHFKNIGVELSSIEVDREGVRVSFEDIYFKPTKKLIDFITKFDNSEKVKPTVIQLRQE